MTIVGSVGSLWRYPVKSMRGEAAGELFVGFAGAAGDRRYAFHSSARPDRFPYLTARQQARMLLYRPRWREGAGGAALEIETPAGAVLAIDDPRLIAELKDGLAPDDAVTLLRSTRAMGDCRPLSLISAQTAAQVCAAADVTPDVRRFRPNVVMDLGVASGFAEDAFVGRTLRLGASARVAIVERDPRCAMIALDPDTAERHPRVQEVVAERHEGCAGIYATVLAEGTVRVGDAVEVVA